MKSLVIGASGLVGSAVCEALGPDRWIGTCGNRPAAGLVHFDLAAAARDPLPVAELMDRVHPDVVYLAAGHSSPDVCEVDEAAAALLHVAGPAAVARACNSHDALLVYFSTDNVFDGFDGPYAESSVTCPINAFGRTKLAGEEAVVRERPGALVVRTCAVYGPEAREDSLAYRLVAALKAGHPVPVSADQYLTPTYSRDLAAAAVALAGAGASGVHHVAGPEVMNAASFAIAVARQAGAPVSLVSPYPTASLSLPAPRPLRGGLRSETIRDLGVGAPRDPAAAFAHWRGNQRGALWPL